MKALSRPFSQLGFYPAYGYTRHHHSPVRGPYRYTEVYSSPAGSLKTHNAPADPSGLASRSSRGARGHVLRAPPHVFEKPLDVPARGGSRDPLCVVGVEGLGAHLARAVARSVARVRTASAAREQRSVLEQGRLEGARHFNESDGDAAPLTNWVVVSANVLLNPAAARGVVEGPVTRTAASARPQYLGAVVLGCVPVCKLVAHARIAPAVLASACPHPVGGGHSVRRHLDFDVRVRPRLFAAIGLDDVGDGAFTGMKASSVSVYIVQ